ncbi:MAG: DUF1538 family protein [Bacillota bacterium]
MRGDLLNKFKESVQSVLPVSAIVLALHWTIAPMPFYMLMLFLTATLLLIVGMSVFSLGAELAMSPIGEAIGAELTSSGKLTLIVAAAFVLGVVVTLAEPDLQVLTKQVPAVPDMVLIAAVAVGVGLFLVLALLRVLFELSLSLMLLVSYAVVFAVAALVAPDYLAVGFDSGGVTTGPITVPFIISFGVGVSAVRGGKYSEEDSFGLCALCSIGPILAVLIMGRFYDPSVSGYAFEAGANVNSFLELIGAYSQGLVRFFQEVLSVLMPIVAIFILVQLVRLKLSRTRLVRILVGIGYTLVGLVVFLTGVNIGFMPAGKYIGQMIASLPYRWILLPLSALIGFFIVYAEPAVHVLNKQIEEITSGAISKRMMMAGLSIGVSVALTLSVLRVLTGASIWLFLLPCYAAALALTFFTPKLFTAIAFDSGGVAAGTMTAAFLLPFAAGVCEAVGGSVMTDAFGVVGMVASMPLVSIQLLGVLYERKLKLSRALESDLQEDLERMELEEPLWDEEAEQDEAKPADDAPECAAQPAGPAEAAQREAAAPEPGLPEPAAPDGGGADDSAEPPAAPEQARGDAKEDRERGMPGRGVCPD